MHPAATEMQLCENFFHAELCCGCQACHWVVHCVCMRLAARECGASAYSMSIGDALPYLCLWAHLQTGCSFAWQPAGYWFRRQCFPHLDIDGADCRTFVLLCCGSSFKGTSEMCCSQQTEEASSWRGLLVSQSLKVCGTTREETARCFNCRRQTVK